MNKFEVFKEKVLDMILTNDKRRGFIEHVMDAFTPCKPPLHAQDHWIRKDKDTGKWKITLI